MKKPISETDSTITDCIERAGVDFICSVPCNMLAGILREIDRRRIPHVPVCREEEGVGVAAGAALAGRRPLLLMQNSGLGNAINALLSLTGLYHLPLFLLMSHRGQKGERIAAQVPMGMCVPRLLHAVRVPCLPVAAVAALPGLEQAMRAAYRSQTIRAALLSGRLWK